MPGELIFRPCGLECGRRFGEILRCKSKISPNPPHDSRENQGGVPQALTGVPA